MKRFNLVVLSIAALLACLVGCSKHENTASNKSSSGSTSDSAVSMQPAGPVELKAKWQPGKQYSEMMDMTQNGHMEMPGSGKPVDQQIRITQYYNIDALKLLPDGGTELELKFTGQKVSSSMGMQIVANFDSSKPTNEDGGNPAAALFRKMVGVPLKYVVDANGKLVRIENLDAFISQIAGSDPQAAASIKGMMSEENLKQMVARGQEALPSKPVKVGDTWPVELKMNPNQMGTLKFDMNYTFKGWQEHDGHHCALLEFTGVITAEPFTNQTFNMTVDNGKNAGKIWFDPAMGSVIGTESKENMTMKMSLQGRNASSQMQQQLETKLVKVADLPK